MTPWLEEVSRHKAKRKENTRSAMRIFLTGVSCVGKTTVGERLATLLGWPFVDVDREIESFFGTPIERLQDRCLTMYSYRKEAARALSHVLRGPESHTCVIALPPSGLMDNFWSVVKRAGGVIVVLEDRPENIVTRLTFYDRDSRPLCKKITEKEKPLYIAEIKKDMSYFGRTYRPAHLSVDISGLGIDAAAERVRKALA